MRKERDLSRKQAEQQPLDDDEGDEEQEEMRICEQELINKNLFEKGIDATQYHETSSKQKNPLDKKYFSEQDMIVHALHVDLLVCLYRCEMKCGKEASV